MTKTVKLTPGASITYGRQDGPSVTIVGLGIGRKKPKKRSHRNDRRRKTARERVTAFGESYYPFFSAQEVRAWTRVLEAHAAATLARHRAKSKKRA